MLIHYPRAHDQEAAKAPIHPNQPRENTDDRFQPFCDSHSQMHVDLDDSCE